MELASLAPLIIRTEAIALRINSFSRTSHVVTWLSPEHGRVATVVKGACRPKSAFLGQYDLFATCELLFYRRDHDGVHAIRECAPRESRDELRDDWRRVTTASYLCDLMARVAQPAQESAALYHLLGATLDDLRQHTPSTDAILRFELAMLRHLGLLPPFEHCPSCHTPERPWLRFALASGHARCAHTAPAAAGEPAITMHRDVLDHLRRLALPIPSMPPNAAILTIKRWAGFPARQSQPGGLESPPSVDEHAATCHGAAPNRRCASAPNALHLSLGSRRFLGIFIRFHLDTPPAPRRLAFELLESVPASLGAVKGESR